MATDDPTLDQLETLRALDTEELMALLGVVGPEVAKLDAQLKEKQTERLGLYVVLEERDVSYRRMATPAQVSDVAVFRLLERFHDRKKRKAVKAAADKREAAVGG